MTYALKLAVVASMLLAPLSSRGQVPVSAKPPQQKTLASENGRYVFGQISEFRRDQFLLDTKTGRLWIKTFRKSGPGEDDGEYVMQPVVFSGPDGKDYLEPK